MTLVRVQQWLSSEGLCSHQPSPHCFVWTHKLLVCAITSPELGAMCS